MIIDDPIGAREDANSQRVRDKIWDWYKADVSPRMKPAGRQILIQSRWHEDDLAGRLLAEIEMVNGGYTWEILVLPAEAEETIRSGASWGNSCGETTRTATRSSCGSRRRCSRPGNWSALYQQRPTRPEG